MFTYDKTVSHCFYLSFRISCSQIVVTLFALKMSNFGHRAVIKYFVKKGIRPNEIFEDMSTTLGDSAPSYSTVKRWAALFKAGRESLEDDERSGRPSTSVNEDTIEKVENLVMADRRLTVRYLAAEVGISTSSVETILHQHLRLNKVSAR